MSLQSLVMINPETKKVVRLSDIKEQKDETKKEAIRLTNDEKVEVANCIVIPFFELGALSNQTFPETFKRVPNSTLWRTLLLETGSYFMLHFFDLILNLNTESLESVIQQFGGPVIEWSNAIQRNARDIRPSWLLWSQHEKLKLLKAKTKTQEKNRERVEKAQAKRALEKQKSQQQTTTNETPLTSSVAGELENEAEQTIGGEKEKESNKQPRHKPEDKSLDGIKVNVKPKTKKRKVVPVSDATAVEDDKDKQ